MIKKPVSVMAPPAHASARSWLIHTSLLQIGGGGLRTPSGPPTACHLPHCSRTFGAECFDDPLKGRSSRDGSDVGGLVWFPHIGNPMGGRKGGGSNEAL